MRLIRTAFAAAIALFWVFVSSHCVLEAVSNVDLFACVSTAAHAADAGDGCDEQCCPVEFGDYHAQRQPSLIPGGEWSAVQAACALESDRESAPEHFQGALVVAPPELTQTWQFFLRSALPIRAPSPTA